MILYKARSVVFYEAHLKFFFFNFIPRIILNTRHFGEYKNVLPASAMIKEPSKNSNLCARVCGWTNTHTPQTKCSRATRDPRTTDYEPLLSTGRLKVGQHVRAHPPPPLPHLPPISFHVNFQVPPTILVLLFLRITRSVQEVAVWLCLHSRWKVSEFKKKTRRKSNKNREITVFCDVMSSSLADT